MKFIFIWQGKTCTVLLCTEVWEGYSKKKQKHISQMRQYSKCKSQLTRWTVNSLWLTGHVQFSHHRCWKIWQIWFQTNLIMSCLRASRSNTYLPKEVCWSLAEFSLLIHSGYKNLLLYCYLCSCSEFPFNLGKDVFLF